MTSVRELSDIGFSELSGISDTARLDSVLILSHVLGISKVKIILNSKEEVSEEQKGRFLSLLDRRKRFEPVAYITGEKEFFGLNFKVDPRVLIPRPETELLIELASRAALEMRGKISFLDLGTGSGCIPIALAKELGEKGKEFSFDAVDKNETCLSVAKENARINGVDDRINFIQSYWFSELGDRTYDIILSNPPYIAEGDLNVSKETEYEPKDALYSGSTGLECVHSLLGEIPAKLKGGGRFFCEIGSSQGRLLMERYGGIKIHRDLAGLDRVLEKAS